MSKKPNKDIHQRALTIESLLKIKPETFWLNRGKKAVLRQYSLTIKSTAYKLFTDQNKKIPNKLDWESFRSLPLLTKENYLKSFNYKDLFPEGELENVPRVISSTSGSTGEPFYFPRTIEQDEQYQLIAELYLRTNFSIHKKTTLYIDAFPMGPWIGGVFTYEVITRIAREGGYPLSIITTSIDSNEIIRVIKKMGKYYDQIIIGSYAPFLKDTLDLAKLVRLDWKSYEIKFVFSAEAFPESFRDYVTREVKSTNIFLDTLNHYGTVDLGTMSYETPVSILIRRMATKKPKLFSHLFGETQLEPTLTQFLPELHYFECVNKHLVCTSNSAIPLMRYDLLDKGGVIKFSDMVDILKQHDIDLYKEAKRVQISDTVWQLPFVYVFERDDLSVSYYAFQVYPGPIRKFLLDRKMQKYVSGKFTMQSYYSVHNKPKLLVNIEMKKGFGISGNRKRFIERNLHKFLIDCNSEYRKTVGQVGRSAMIKVRLWKNQEPRFFKSGIKQKWIVKNQKV